MKNKILNIISVIVTIVVFALVLKGQCMKNQLGNFPINALDGAVPRITNAIADARAGTEKLVAVPEKTYMNFVRPLMDIDEMLSADIGPVAHLDSVNNSDETKKIMETILPVLAEYSSDMARDKGIYQGFLDIRKNEYDNLDVAQKRVVDDAIEGFELSGIALPKDKQEHLKKNEARLTKLANDFSNNIIAANQKFKLKITDEKLLGDMPESDKAAARVEDGFEFTLLAPSYLPFMEYVTDRDLRAQMYRASGTRAPENEELIVEILSLRQENAKILGFENYAELAIKTRSAPSPDAVNEFLARLGTGAKPFAIRDQELLSARAKKDGIDMQPWDRAFYYRIVREENYKVSDTETKPYFELNATVNGLFEIVGEMFDIEFKERDVPLWNKGAKYYDVIQNGRPIAGLYMDLQTRASKSTGAWMDDHSRHFLDANGNRHLAEVFIVANFPVEKDGVPSLLGLSDVNTLFHEMGHGLHGLLTKVSERDVSGANVDRDVVEFPSQFLEAFWNTPNVLKRIAKHYQTGETMPDELIARIVALDRFDKGYFLVRQLEFGMFDMAVHTAHNLDSAGVQKIYDDVRKSVAVFKIPEFVKHQNTFSHIFSGGYAAGYYSYLWADVMAADAFVEFDKNPFNKNLARKYRDVVLAQGGSKKMDDIYREFIGHDPNPESLLKKYGLK